MRDKRSMYYDSDTRRKLWEINMVVGQAWNGGGEL
jgi:hypothetical protein